MPTWNDVLDLAGFSSALTRTVMNRAVSTVPDARILEVGTYLGSTAVAMCHGNDVRRIHCVDNHSEFGNTRQQLAATVSRFELPAICHDLDFFKDLRPDEFGGTKFNVYLYDGPHEEEHHASELGIAWPHLADSFVYMVDDYSWDKVRRGCERGLAEFADRLTLVSKNVYDSTTLNDHNGYWNGLLVAWCVKK